MGPRGGDRLRARARHPVKGGTEAPPYSIDDNLWGRSSEGGAIEDIEEPPHDDVFNLVTRPEDAPDEAEDVVVGFEKGCPVSLNGERLELVELLERAGRSALATASGSWTTSRTDRGPQGARPLRGAGRGDHPHRPQGA
jgi:argininosuccinate synthase